MNSSDDQVRLSRYRIRRRWWMRMYRYTRWRWHVVFAVVDLLGWLVFGPPRMARGLTRRLLRKDRGETVRRILVVQLDHLGDAVLSTGMLRVLRREYPLARVDVLCSAWNRELFELLPEVADIHEMRGSRFLRGSRPPGWRWVAEILRRGWRLRRKEYDLAIDVRGEFPHAMLMWLAGAKRRLGWRAGGGGFLLTDSPRWVAGRHEVLSRLALLNKLGIECDADDLAPHLPGESRRSSQGPTVALHISAGTEAKCWPLEHWRGLIARLTVEFGAALRLVGGPDDAGFAAELLEELESLDVRNLVGGTSTADLVAVLQDADLFIGPDSGPAHLAAAVGTPAVVLFSGTNDPNQWRPWGQHVAVVRHAPPCSPCHRQACPLEAHPCMTGLTPELVMAAVRVRLSQRYAAFAPGQAKPIRKTAPLELEASSR